MNILFLTQAKTLAVFYDVMRSMREKTALGKVGFYIADSSFWEKFRQGQPEFESAGFELLKEWEILRESSSLSPDHQKLRELEMRLGDPVFWNALVADRRIYLGKKATLEQDYRSRFSHERMISVLQVGLEEMERLFDRVKPDAVVGFICVTIGEYLAYLLAKSRGIPFLNLRPTRIKNYFFAGESIFEPSRRLEEAYRSLLKDGICGNLRKEAESYLAQVRETHAMYEGVLPPPGDSATKVAGGDIGRKASLLRTFKDLAKEYYDYTFGQYRYDNHHRGVVYPIWFQRIRRPMRVRRNEFSLRNQYVKRDELAALDYAFYPLHKEPEVTLLVYGRPYLNQIEVVRNFARNLPLGMKLVVKEHPASLGYRPLSYYKKLLTIPNVRLASPTITSRDLIEKARLIAIVGGSVGLEAMMMRKPVVHVGNVPFSFLPNTMIRKVQDLERLGWETCDILENHRHDEEALVAYLAAVTMTSVPIDFYSTLLGRRAVYRPSRPGVDAGGEYTTQIDALSDYLTKQISEARLR